MTAIALGLDSFGDVNLGADGQPVPMQQVLRDVVEQAVLADGRVLADFRTEKFSDAQSLAAHYHDTVRAASPLEASS